MKLQPANRIATLKPYFFANLGPRIAKLAATGLDIVRMDIGSPDLPPSDSIIEALVERVRRPDVHGYTAFGGTPAYREAVAGYYARRFGVELDPASNIVGLIGSKEGIFTTSQVVLDPGDTVLIPDPGYGTYSNSALIAGAEIHPLPLLAENDFLPRLADIPENVASRAKLLWLNYPNNPTGAVAGLDFYAAAVEFALANNILIGHDTPYVDVCYGGYTAPSIMQVPGAMECAIEFTSLSKVYNMAGWRLGAVVGNPDAIRLIWAFKSQKDTAHFEPMLHAGICALEGDQTWVRERNAIYERRLAIIMQGLKEMGLEPVSPKAALYTWTPTPGGMDDVAFCERLLHETGVSTTPGSVFGPSGSGYFRMTVCAPEERISEAMRRMVRWARLEDDGQT